MHQGSIKVMVFKYTIQQIIKTYEAKQVEFDITKITQKVTAQGHTNRNNIEELSDIINMPDTCVSEWMCIIY